MLEALGFGPIEEHLYDLLLTRGRLSLADVLAEGREDPRLQRQALDTLVTKGLVRQLTGPDHEYVIAPPEQAIEVLIAEQTRALQAVRASAAEAAARVRRVAQEVDPTELIEIVSGEGSVRQLFLQVIKSARREIAVFDCPPYATDIETGTQTQEERLSTGDLRLRTVFDRSLLEDPTHVRRILRGLETGEEGRVASVPLKLAIIDSEWGMLPLLHADGRTPEATMLVRRSVLLDSMVALFESVWQQAVEIKPPDGDELQLARTPEGELRQLSQLLATGMTETAIAHHLGVSDRTVRRRIKDLMAELKVDSRFAAGVRAAERGWL